jgi:dihydroorotate dehydrogenase
MTPGEKRRTGASVPNESAASVIGVYRWARPLLFALPAEAAHGLAVWALANGLGPRAPSGDDPILAQNLWGLAFPNPVGLAAGFDKDARAISGALRLGFGFVEAGTVTPLPQKGNPSPRLFRLTEDRALINRLGFNSGGLDRFVARMTRRPERIVGANVGRNKDGAEEDFARGVAAVAPLADYVVINVSSPNTPGLRALQRREALARLLDRLSGLRGTKPLLVKIAPDLTPEERSDIAEVAMGSGVDGLIVSNTTVARPATLRSRHRAESGGLSGAPLFAPSTEALADFRRLTAGRLTLIGCGGVASGADAYAKIRAGASLVQLYTALIYRGPGLVPEIKRDLAALLRRDGFASISQAVGAG